MVLRDNKLSDQDRLLNQQGKNQAAAVGKLIKNNNLSPDYITSSSAKRAIDTSKIVGKFSGYNEKIDINPTLYHQNSRKLYQCNCGCI